MKSFEEFRSEQEEYLLEKKWWQKPGKGGGKKPPKNQGGRGPSVADVIGVATAPLRWGGAAVKGLADTALKTAAGQAGNLIKGKVGSTGSTHGKELQGLPKNS